MLFYDFEVFKKDWLVVIIDLKNQKETVIINDKEKLEEFYNLNKSNVWIGFNSRGYDQYILKGILCGFNPKLINDFIIVENKQGWQFSRLFNKIQLFNYDVMNGIDRGLKFFEGSMGNNIKESSVPFDIDRKLTEEEIEETIKYCRHDVEQTIEVFIERKEDFEAQLGLVKLASDGEKINLSLISKTKPQFSAYILEAKQKNHDDEFEIDFPDTLKIEKYKNVVDWYKNEENLCYKKTVEGRKNGVKNQLEIRVAGVPHVFGFGGVHGALEKYIGEGYFLNVDVASLYPSLMIEYNLHSRNMKDPAKYTEIYNKRLQYKAEKNPLQKPLKLVLNSTYGAMKDKHNALYDPRQANRVCIYGQLLLLDLIEKLEPYAEIIQSNTDGILMKKPDSYVDIDEWFNLIDDICFEWEKRTRLKLEFDEYKKVIQKDVNNYILVDFEGNYKTKGAYVKQLNNIDYGDFPIINKALVDYFVKGIPVEKTINDCDLLKEFQLVTKISSKYKCIQHGEKILNEKCIRVFASKNKNDKGVFKIHAQTKSVNKISNSPENCFIFNDDIEGVKTPSKLDRSFYINLANKRIKDFIG